MAVNKDSANWRLFGGGGLLVGGVLWLLGQLLGLAAVPTAPAIVGAIGVLVVGIALFFVAFGQTGSNGAVGNSLLGKIALVAAAVGWILVAAGTIFAAFGTVLPAVVTIIAVILVVVGGVLATFVIYQRGVARGAARWVFAVPTVLSIVWALFALGWVVPGATVVLIVALLLAAAYAVTGLLYLLNRRDVG